MAGTRLQIVGAFVLFALLATPIAWQLTQVERVDLPVQRIKQLSWENSRFGGPHTFHVNIVSLDSKFTSAPPSSAPNVVYSSLQLQLNEAQNNQLHTAVRAGLQATDDALETLQMKNFSVFLLCDEDATASAALIIGKHHHAWTTQCHVREGDAVHSAIERLIQRHVYPHQDESGEQPMETNAARRALKYRLQFSLLKENPVTLWQEDLQTLVDQYLGRFIHKVGAVANFTVETQVLQYARLAKEVTASADGTEFYLNAEDLKQFKSANDFLDASVLDDREQVLHFMAALPDLVHSPLFIQSDDEEQRKRGLATSFELPGWGIAVILNPHTLNTKPSINISEQQVAEIKRRELQRVMGLFVSEFRTLLGVASFTHRQREEDLTGGDRIQFLSSSADGIADWELDVVMRDRFTELIQTAIETLQSTVQLVETLPELSVLQRVQLRVETAVTSLETILCTSNSQDCVEVYNLPNMMVLARQASELTDAAYYDHTMIRQLYFPQEQILGVYAPLLAPLILPFLLGLVRELKRFKAKRAAKKKAD